MRKKSIQNSHFKEIQWISGEQKRNNLILFHTVKEREVILKNRKPHTEKYTKEMRKTQ